MTSSYSCLCVYVLLQKKFLQSWNLIYSFEKYLYLVYLYFTFYFLSFCKMRCLLSKPTHSDCDQHAQKLPLLTSFICIIQSAFTTLPQLPLPKVIHIAYFGSLLLFSKSSSLANCAVVMIHGRYGPNYLMKKKLRYYS